MRTIIEILITNACNRRCSYCVARSKDSRYDSQTMKTNEYGDYKLEPGIINIPALRRWLLKQRHLDPCAVITGGEPTIARHYTDLLDWLYDNEFKVPILCTNGLNIKDLAFMENAREKAKVILTQHLDNDISDCALFLKDMEIPTLIKVLANEKSDMEEKRERARKISEATGFKTVIEGIRRPYPDSPDEMARIAEDYPNAFDGSSPYKWRWNGYGDRIGREQTNCTETVVWTVDPTGLIFNCHCFANPLASIYDCANLSDVPAQLAWCCDDMSVFKNGALDVDAWRKTATKCELQHYVNLMESMKLD
ncbi:MAG: hypothetical protein LBH25_09195 [Fibromonadaceae bacterium]|jgi:organic radical activating enzyme|nr:hypothetical protein [Fibromonadaceae bacterium]